MQASIPLGTVVGGRWQVSGVLGEGGFGQVLLAEDTSEVGLGEAAVKVLHPNTTPQERRAFLIEVKKIATLRHPNLVGYLDSGQLQLDDEIRPYLVTERCALSLADHTRRSPTGTLSPAETLAVLADLAAGLAHLHQQGLIHRDIKPGNALWSDGRWKLADFGLMRDLSATGSYHRAGTLMGTPLFMAPELFATMEATPASDLYALGVLAHLCPTGRHVHTGVGPVLIHNVATLPPTLDPALAPTLAPIVSRCTHPDPMLRPSAIELLHLVRVAQSGQIVPGAPALLAPAPPTIVAPPPATTVPPAGWRPPTPAPPVDTVPPMSPAPPLHTAPPMSPAPPLHTAPPMSPAPPFHTAPPMSPAPPPSTAPPMSTTPTGPGRGPGSGAPRLLVLVGGAVGGLLLVAALGGALLALTADRSSTGGGDAPDSDVTDRDVSIGADVTIGDDVTIGGGVAVDRSTPTDTGTVADPQSHLVTPACEGENPAPVVEVENRHTNPVDYLLTTHHFDAAGVRIGEWTDTVAAIAPGQRALLRIKPSEEGAVTCQVVELMVRAVEPALVADGGSVTITACDLDEFFGDFYDVSFTVSNPYPYPIDASISFAVTDADGVIIDQGIGTSITDIAPGQTVQGTTGDFYSNVELSTRPVTSCAPGAVQFTDAS